METYYLAKCKKLSETYSECNTTRQLCLAAYFLPYMSYPDSQLCVSTAVSLPHNQGTPGNNPLALPTVGTCIFDV